ncbi:hypothetical protein [Streptomyces sp. NPDC127190]|uniref:hypothetical protein n=1 Tax=unclassified Streptomyces TaxID=2593676 RepID=UPI003633815A
MESDEYGLVLVGEPSPRPSCPTCLSLAVERTNARSCGNLSAVTDANVLLRRHQQQAH